LYHTKFECMWNLLVNIYSGEPEENVLLMFVVISRSFLLYSRSIRFSLVTTKSLLFYFVSVLVCHPSIVGGLLE